jgi:type I restriction enzyme S subunit
MAWNNRSFAESANLIRDVVQPNDIGNIPYIGLEHISQGQLSLLGFGSSDEVVSIKSRFRKGDILFGKLRPYFRKVILAPFDGVCSTDIWVIRAKPGVNQKFLFYWMASSEFVDTATRASEGTKMPRAKWEFVERIERFMPEEGEQCAIAEVLGSLDDKIALNRRMNQTLEALAQAIFKSWFIDFEPVRAKMEGRAPAGMDAKIAALFPDAMDCDVPKGWRKGSLAGEFNLTMGQSPPGSTYNELKEGLPFFQGRTDFGFRFPTNRVYCTGPTRYANPGDTLVSVRAPVGDINMAAEYCALGRGVAAVRHKSGSRSFTYYCMRSIQSKFKQFEAEGTVFGSINKDDFKALEVFIPDKDILNLFEQLAHPIDQMIENNEKEIITLSGLRDLLLPKLLSGEVKVDSIDPQTGL